MVFESWPKLKAAVEGVTAEKLHEAVESGDLKAARELLTRRPEIVDLGRGEMRALHMAVLKRDLAMTNLLLEFGADYDAGIWPKRDATSPTSSRRIAVTDEIVEVFRTAREKKRRDRGPKVPEEAFPKIRQAHLSGSEEAMLAVLEEYPQLAEKMSLQYAAGRGALLIMKWLLDHGADVNKTEDTLFHGATFLPRLRKVDAARLRRGGLRRRVGLRHPKVPARREFLLEHGAQLTPLSAASLGRWDYLEKFSKAGSGGQKAYWRPPSRATSPRLCAACSTWVSILTSASRSVIWQSRPGPPAARCFKPWC